MAPAAICPAQFRELAPAFEIHGLEFDKTPQFIFLTKTLFALAAGPKLPRNTYVYMAKLPYFC